MPPPLPTAPIAIPVIPRSPSKHDWTKQTSKISECQPRTYSKDPLPIRPSDEAPRKAHITGRIAEPDRVAYTIEIGGVQVDDVGIDEILEYVSAYDLEQYENRKFEEEGEILKVARLEAEAEAERRRERQRHRAKTKGTVLFQEVSDDDDDEDQSDETGSAVGRHGRSRPTYTHLFEKGRQRKRRRKRDPDTGELMPLSDEEIDVEPVIPDLVLPVSNRPPAPPFAALPKRRRRKRDKATGELLPLDPLGQGSVTEDLASRNDEDSEVDAAPPFQQTVRSSATKVGEPPRRRRRERDVHTGELLPLESLDKRLSDEKRPRRRRHPLTGELMPLGWRYDPKAEGTTYERRQDGTGSDSQVFKRLSLSQEQEPKRLKLTSGNSSDEIVHPYPKPSTPKQRSFNVKSERSESDERSMRHEHEEDDDESEMEVKPTPRPASVHRSGATPKASLLRPDARANMLSKAAVDTASKPMNLNSFLGANRQHSSSAESSSSSEMDVKKFQERSKVTAATIMNPVAAAHGSEDEEEDDDGEEEGWDIENILAHQMSDPRTHPGKPSGE
ncbi:Hypothetical predicted protein [Lecanosticta acicola]|uniref:Uncharacterized protein n=1 Tax=Lecanosticta acicola TaxID=111012 RepID=A0AAI9EDK2_9PEZI|nr:Hypothetical predicted protein [Lecanosticta acicola]